MRIKKAGKEDFVEMHKLLVGIFPNALLKILENDEFFIAKDGEILGFAHFYEDEKKIVLKGFGVAESRRKGGVGGSLLDKLASYAKKKGKNVYLKTKIRNPALRLYCRKGFCFKKLKGETLTMVCRMAN